MGEETDYIINKTADIEELDLVLDPILDRIDEIRNTMTDDVEITNKATLDLLDKFAEIMSEFYKDLKKVSLKVNQVASIAKNLSLFNVAEEVIEEEMEEEKEKGFSINGGDIYS